MNQSICNICGANYENRNGRWKCPACGAYKPEEISNEELTLMFVADQKRRMGDFEEAERAYTDIIEKYPQNSYGYWGRLLSKHGIKYERDYDGRMIPTCCAPTIESLYSDKDCLSAIDLADSDTKQYFTSQAEYIESVRDLWVKKASKEKPYDIFICYKDSDLANNIHRTADSIDAQNLYTHLVEKGYRVFFSRESLRDKIGEKYEPYIFGALSTAKVMIVYGKSSEYITSTWLKNEWSRYLKLMREGSKKSNSLIVAYEGFSPSELPTALSSAQCLDASGWNFYPDLDRAIKSILEVKKQETKKEEPQKEPFAKKSKTKAITCPACGGNFSSTDLLDGDKIVTCLDCGKSFLTSDILKENGNPFKHTPKPKTPKRDLTYEEIRMAEERALKFKKGKFSKLILFTLVIFAALTMGMFSNGNILLGFLAAGVASLSLVSYLCGMQIIKKGNINLHILPAILAFALIVPYCIVGGGNLITLNWDDVILKDKVPTNDFKYGNVSTNSGEELWIYDITCSEKEFNSYISTCKDFGYDYEIIEEDSHSYIAFSEDGYKIDLSYYSDLTLKVYAPIKMSNIQWPQSDIAKLLPTPKSSYGHIESEYTTSFDIYIGNTSFEEYKQYVEAVYQSGFTVDYRKDTNQFTADNADGYYVRIEYIGFNIMEIYIRDP